MENAKNHKVGDFVAVKGAGAAKIDDIIDGTYFMFFAAGQRGQGWRDRDIERTITKSQFWSEWRRFKAFN